MHWTFAYLLSEKLFSGCAKCVFGQTKAEYLEYIVFKGVFTVYPAIIRAIMDWPEPICVKLI